MHGNTIVAYTNKVSRLGDSCKLRDTMYDRRQMSRSQLPLLPFFYPPIPTFPIPYVFSI